MPIDARYVFIASMDVDVDKEAIFNEVYDTEHIPPFWPFRAYAPPNA